MKRIVRKVNFVISLVALAALIVASLIVSEKSFVVTEVSAQDEGSGGYSTLDIMSPVAAGDLDLTFNGTGKTVTNVNTGNDIGTGVAIQADGKIVMTGNASNGTNFDFALVRYNVDGTLDSTFGAGGIAITPLFTMQDIAEDLAIQADGKIVVAGYGQFFTGNATFTGAVARYNSNGTLDTTFSGDGWVPAGSGISRWHDVAIQPDGKIVMAGVGSTGTDQMAAGRLNADGTPDATFGGFPGSGLTLVLTTELNGRVNQASSVALQSNGKIVVGGSSASGSAIFLTARLNANGSLDTTFDSNGTLLTANSTGVTEVLALSDGKIISVGSNGSDSLLVRHNVDGTPDATFGTSGRVTTDFSGNDGFRAATLQPDGKIVAVGSNSLIDNHFTIGRYNIDGSLDTTFSGDGKQTVDFGTTSEAAQSVALDSTGRIVVAGFSNNMFAATRLMGDPAAPGETAFDFDGDGRADVSVFRPSDGIWYLNRSTAGFTATQWGNSSDKIAPADYDGDGKTDVAVWRSGAPTVAGFYFFESLTNTVRFEQFGQTDDLPLAVGDWDGDGKADPAVYRDSAFGSQSYFFYRGSLNNPNRIVTYLPWGTTGDKPMRGDFDGDGKLDAAVFRPSNNVWYIRNSSNGSITYDNWGLSTDKFVPADYDGDSKTDLAVFRNGTWYIKQSSAGQPQFVNWGLPTDTPVPADYDGDGKTDTAVFRNGVWYLNQSTSGVAYANFGLGTDSAVPNAYIAP